MDNATTISQLKEVLLHDVTYLCQRYDRVWNEPIVQTLRDIRDAHVPAVFFGGTLRSLLLSRLQNFQLGRPRDIDIVVAGTTVDGLRERFGKFVTRETRFGGLQLERTNWHFDIWPLHRTWAFLQDETITPEFAGLPSTTFFNLEAIAVDVWPSHGHSRLIYSGDDQFFYGILKRTLEVNREENPFPALCVVRAIVMALSTRFAVGPRLSQYLITNGNTFTDKELNDIQYKHYGKIRCDIGTIRNCLNHIEKKFSHYNKNIVTLPFPYQMTFWPKEDKMPELNVRLLSHSEYSHKYH